MIPIAWTQNACLLAGRFLLGLYFILPGISKITGYAAIDLLEKVQNLIRGGMPLFEGLTEAELAAFERVRARVDKICQTAVDQKTPVFIDAEETWIQNTIDDIVYQMSAKYNQEKAIVYNTVQMYRHDRLAFLEKEIERAREENWKLGVKIVRGAYMEKERDRAAEKGYPSPIQPDKPTCDKDFNAALELSVKNIDVVSICAGTHNEESSLYLADLLKKNNIPFDDSRVFFAQLLGMSDHISFNLADNGLMVAKYVPYGPIKEVLPYLIRRAEENTSVAGQTSRELSLIMKEMKRRKLS